MKYLELTINTTAEAEELVSSKLWEYSSYGVSICNDNDIIELINNRRNTWDYMEDGLLNNLGYNATLVKCYFDLNVDKQVLTDLRKDLYDLKENSKGFLNFGTLEIIEREVDGDDWIDVWRKHYRPIDIGSVVICPYWLEYTPKNDQIVVYIDSNLAFGTGEHETTSMCIDFLNEINLENKTVLDVGTGSGILGITAIKLGAKKSIMTDIDPVAVDVAKHNAKINGVLDNCDILLDDLLSNNDTFGDVVVANITADILIILANTLKMHLNKGSKIILSGILREKASEVVEVYKNLNLKLLKSSSKGEWVALLMEQV